MNESTPRKGPWSLDRIERYLADARLPFRLACNSPSGHPLVATLWFVPIGDTLWCATQKTASLASCLARDPRCSYEVADDVPPYRGVRGQAIASLHESRGEEILRLLIARYLKDPESAFSQWLLQRAENETAIAVEPKTVLSWDYTKRMGDAA